MSLITTPHRLRALGIVANAYGDPYSLSIAHGAAQELTRSGKHALFFGGGFPQAPLFRDAQNACALPSGVDAWILIGETLRDVLGDVMLAARSARRAVMVGCDLPGLACAATDAETGIFQAVAHLAKRHERRRIAFIAGPEGSLDASQRLGAYRLAMDALGLYADPALLVVGDYQARSGREAMRQLERQHGTFDAVVAANDLMALGALESLCASGTRVPEDVSVVGFDDIEESAFAAPSLTTVRQPLAELGHAAARLALASDDRDAMAAERMVVPTPLVIRNSCGCKNSEPVDRRSVPPDAETSRTQNLREEALREVARRTLGHARVHRDLERLAESVVRSSDFSALARVMSAVVELLGLRRFLLCTYAGGQRNVRVALESTGRDVVFHHQSQPFPIDELVPPGFLKTARPLQLVVEPLEFADEHFGYLVLEGDLRDGLAHVALRHHLGCALARMARGRELRRLYAAEKRRTEA